MSLIVEDGSIVTNANTYISLANAKTFLEDFYGEYDTEAAAFLGFGTSRQELILRRAAYDLDRRYRKQWKGFKRVQDQALDWPRVDVADEDDYDVPEDSIPRRLQRAQLEIAKRLANDVAIFEDRDRGGRVKSEKVDVISITYFDNAPSETLFEGLEATLTGLLAKENRVVRA